MKLHKIFLIAVLFIARVVFTQSPFAGGESVITKWSDSFNLPNIVESKPEVVLQLPRELVTTNWTEFSFSAGDTTESFDVNHAKTVYIIFRDSSITGTDSLWLGTQVTLSNGILLKAAISVHSLAQTTITTYVSNPVIPGDNSTVGYAFNPINVATTFTGTIFISRLNGVNSTTPYAAVTRGAYCYE